MLNSKVTEPSKVRTKHLVDDTHGKYNTNSQIKFKSAILKSSQYNSSDFQRADPAAISVDRNNKQVVFKTFAPFTDHISERNNTIADNA